MADVDAVILVGGLGTRLRPLTLSAPKPMLPTAGVPFLTHLIARIQRRRHHPRRARHVVPGRGLRGPLRRRLGASASSSTTWSRPRRWAPAAASATSPSVLRGDTVLVFNGDNLIGVDLNAFLATHRAAAADVTLCLHRVADPRAYGCVPTDADGRVTAFLEKDPNPVTDQINAGLYAFRRSVIDTIPTGRAGVGRARDLPGPARRRRHACVGHVNDGYWRDFGTPADFVAGSADLVRGLAPVAGRRRSG